MVKITLIVVIGAVAGGLMGYLGQCTTGACPLTATPIRGAGFGAVLGLLIAMTNTGGRIGSREPLQVSDHIMRVSDLASLQTLIAGADVPVMVDFYADWCGPCKRLAPELSALADAWKGNAIIVKVNVDDQCEVAASYRISSIPDIRVFSGGAQQEVVTGYRSQQALHALLVAVGGVPPEGV
jgi:thioredoxin 1